MFGNDVQFIKLALYYIVTYVSVFYLRIFYLGVKKYIWSPEKLKYQMRTVYDLVIEIVQIPFKI